MEFEAFKEEVDKNITSLFNKANDDEKVLLNRMVNVINDLSEEKQELIDYLKDLIDNKHTNNKVLWFDSEYAKTYGELCNMAGYKANRLALVPLSEIEKILSKIEKE